MPVDVLKDSTTVKQAHRRKRKPRIVAVINDSCTGCSGSPACVDYCPVENCMVWVTDPEAPTLGLIEVDALLCIGCKLCISKGPADTFLDGCPWDAIDMVDIDQVEASFGSLPW